MADCIALGQLYSAEFSLLYSPAEAMMLLGKACEAGASEVCRDAASMALYGTAPPAAAQAERWHAIGCADGVEIRIGRGPWPAPDRGNPPARGADARLRLALPTCAASGLAGSVTISTSAPEPIPKCRC